MPENLTTKTPKHKKQTFYSRLPLVALILTALSVPMFGVTLPYAIGAGTSGMIRFFQSPEKTIRLFLLCLVAFISSFLACLHMIGVNRFLGPVNLTVCSVITLWLFFIADPKKSVTSEIIATLIIVATGAISLLRYLWFVVGTTVLGDGDSLGLFAIGYRLSLAFLLPATFIFLMIRTIRYASTSRRTLICVVLIPACVVSSSLNLNHFTDEKAFLRGLGKAVEEELNIDAIQVWLSEQQIPERLPDTEEDGLILIQAKNQPHYIRALSNNKKIGVRYDWDKKQFYTGRRGSILFLFCFRWGLYISSGVCDEPDWLADGEYLPLSPSVFVWCSYSG